MANLMMTGALVTAAAGLILSATRDADSGTTRPSSKVFTMEPIGWVRTNNASAPP